jgi:hypothetical protein
MTRIGDMVLYDGAKYTIEHDYGNGVFRIGNDDAFVDLVNASMLTNIPKGWEPITIDGIECLIGWTNTDYGDCWEDHYAVTRHGCQIGKAVERDNAIADARKTLETAWLRGPRPAHFGVG